MGPENQVAIDESTGSSDNEPQDQPHHLHHHQAQHHRSNSTASTDQTPWADQCPVLSYNHVNGTANQIHDEDHTDFVPNGVCEPPFDQFVTDLCRGDYTKNGYRSSEMTLSHSPSSSLSNTATATTETLLNNKSSPPSSSVVMDQQQQNGHGYHLSNSCRGDQKKHDTALSHGAATSCNESTTVRHRFQQQQPPKSTSDQQQQMNGMAKSSTAANNVMLLDHNKNHQCELPVSPSSDAAQRQSNSLCGSTTSRHRNGFIAHNSYHNSIPCSDAAGQSNCTTTSHAVKSREQISRKSASSSRRRELYEEPPFHIACMCYLSYVVLTVFGYLRDFMRKSGLEKNLAAVERNREGYPRLYKNFESFYTRNIYRRIRDCWNRPIASVPGAYIDVVDRVSHDYNWTFEHPGTTHQEINMGSYNYLGFAENSGPIHDTILDTVHANRVGVCSVRAELGTSKTVDELESLMAQFLGVDSCIVFGMGFATNSTNIATLVSKGCLILSDEMNHASLILGCRLSGATTRVFKHNDMEDLERKVRKYIVEGQPKTHRPWKKIIILAEGIYSMEGTIINLPELIRIKKQYRCYVYLDEAHSIGALGPNGRGVVDYYNCDPRDIDVLMGTFTKSFGAAGGYIAGSAAMVAHVRANSYSSTYANAMSPVIAQQIACVVRVLMGLDGTDVGAKRIAQLARNTRYFRRRLAQMGFIVYGNDDSPVVPLLLCFCPKIAAVIRLAQAQGLGFIGAGFPATSLTTGRVRFCISAAHTKAILDRSLEVMSTIGDQIGVKYSRYPPEIEQIDYDTV